MPPEKGNLLARAGARCEGWYAAVARAAEAWESVDTRRRQKHLNKGQEEERKADRAKAEQEAKEREKRRRPKEGEAEAAEKAEEKHRDDRERQEEEQRRLEAQREQERLERQLAEERKARERRQEEDRKKAEEERKRWEKIQKQRKEKLRGAFSLDENQDDEDSNRETALLRKVAERKREATELASRSTTQELVPRPTAAVLPSGEDLSTKLRFEPGLDPAEAFMRLQERKRKGRRAEFGGPPRGCSPWRDGKRGITYAEPGKDGV